MHRSRLLPSRVSCVLRNLYMFQRVYYLVCPILDILYLRTTSKLSNRHTQWCHKMECSYLSATSEGKICRIMVDQKLDGELDDFDITHYCKGNPNHCYFYRSYSVQRATNKQLELSRSKKIQVTFFDELSKRKLGDVEISVEPRGDPAAFSKLIKRRIR